MGNAGSRKMTTKILIRDLKHGEQMRKTLDEIAKEKGIELKTTVEREEGYAGSRWPIESGYDIYLLHLSQVHPEDLLKLRKGNKKGLVYGIWGGTYTTKDVPPALRDGLDNVYLSTSISCGIDDKELRNILDLWNGGSKK
jgi:hypothetical protein